MNILAQYNNLFKKDELVYIEDPILKYSSGRLIIYFSSRAFAQVPIF